MGPPLVSLVVMNEVVKTIMTILSVLTWKLSIAWDRGSIFSQSVLKTKCSTSHEYIETHLGPEYELNERIAG
jgi:hypothetical protein